MSGVLGDVLIKRELTSAITRATDSVFLSLITTGITSIPSSGTTALGVRQDLRVLLQNLSTGATSALYLVVGPNIAKAWSMLPDASGAAAFPGMTYLGGEIGGITVLVSTRSRRCSTKVANTRGP